MRSEVHAISSARVVRKAVGAVLWLAGLALLVAHGVAWLRVH